MIKDELEEANDNIEEKQWKWNKITCNYSGKHLRCNGNLWKYM